MNSRIAPPSPADDAFVAADRATLRIVPLDVMTLVYHRASGITHVVASPVPELIEALAEPATLNALIARLAVTYDLPDIDRTALAERLAELAAAGLVARA